MAAEVPWTPEETKRLRDLLNEGMTRAAIADRLGRSKNSVVGKVIREGWADPARNPVKGADTSVRWSAEDLATLRARMREGKMIREIAVDLGRSVSSVGAKVIALGINRGRSGRVRNTLDEAFTSPAVPVVPAVHPIARVIERAPAVPPRNPGECAWPVRETPNAGRRWEFCHKACHITAAGRRWPYCAEHGRLAYGREKQPTEEAYP